MCAFSVERGWPSRSGPEGPTAHEGFGKPTRCGWASRAPLNTYERVDLTIFDRLRKGIIMNRRGVRASASTRVGCQALFISGIALASIPRVTGAGGVVTNPTEVDLREALSDGGLVTFACDGTITLSATITNLLDTTLDGSSHNVTLSGGDALQVFRVAGGSRLSLSEPHDRARPGDLGRGH